MTIDYKQPTKFNRNVTEMLEFLLWTTCTAGKSSAEITPKFNALSVKHSLSNVILYPVDTIKDILRDFKIGQYTRIAKAWDYIGKAKWRIDKPKTADEAKIDNQYISSGVSLRHAPRDCFSWIDGVGMKTASFFVMSNRKWEEVATLDTHILKWLREEFPHFSDIIPKQTPTNRLLYKEIEALFVGATALMKHPNGNPYTCAELDLEIWKSYNNNN